MACGSSIESMYRGVVSKVRFSHEYRAKFSEQEVYTKAQTSALSLFITVLQTKTEEFKTSFSWELLYTGDFDLIAESVTELWKQSFFR